MRSLFFLTTLLVANAASAQVEIHTNTLTTFPTPNTAVTTTTKPAGTIITAPAAPVAPTVQKPTVASPALAPVPAAGASGQPAAPSMMDELSKLMPKQSKQQTLQQGIVVASIMGCTSKKVGQAATDNFYQRMQEPGKKIGELCKTGKAEDARREAIFLFKEHHRDPVAVTAADCYEANQQNISMLAGLELSKDLANYERWIRDPKLMDREMTTEDICR